MSLARLLLSFLVATVTLTSAASYHSKYLFTFQSTVQIFIDSSNINSQFSSASQGDDSDEDRFYIDDSNWPVLEEWPSKSQASRSLEPTKTATYENVTVKVGRQALLPCFVDNLGGSKVIWARNGDILALATTKINSDPRLNVQHRYLSEWHLIIDNVATEDEGEYICKTNGEFYKTINLQVLSKFGLGLFIYGYKFLGLLNCNA